MTGSDTSSPVDSPSSGLAEILDKSEQTLKSELEEYYSSFISHKPTAGASVEDVLKKWLRNHLPSSIGVTSGFAMDITGKKTKQLDVILYDAQRTPIFLSIHGVDLIPIEGILAVVEVKAHLRTHDIQTCIQNCLSLKQLQPSAYSPDAMYQGKITINEKIIYPKIIYSVFAMKSDHFMANKLNESMSGLPIDKRIDTLCYLDRGISINLGIERENITKTTIPLPRTGIIPFQYSCLADVQCHALTTWFSILSTYILKESVPSINIEKYVESELSRTVTTENKQLIQNVLHTFINQQNN
ncbi:hypothetical protein BTHE_1454 [Bifidobacterium thermophilum]|nr:hypothetical protein BTHE_1454 [Bifidobacterium thermophilum]